MYLNPSHNLTANNFKPKMIFKPGAPGFYRLILFAKYVCVCVCVSAPKVSNNQWRDVA